MMAIFDKLKRTPKGTHEIELQPNESEAGSPDGGEADGDTQRDRPGGSFFDKFKRGKKDNPSEIDGEPAVAVNDQMDDGEHESLEEEAVKSHHHSLLEKIGIGKKENQVLPEPSLESSPLPDEETVAESAEKGKISLMDRFKLGLTKTRKNIGDKIDNLINSTRKLDDEFWEELEDILIQADVGMNTSLALVGKIRTAASKQKIKEPGEITGLIQNEIAQLLGTNPEPLNIAGGKPAVILVVGVNGAGKTTSIAKLAYRLKHENQQVMLAAGDTFRAAAIDQLQIWADRVGVELIKHQEGSDPGAVVYDAISAARARQADVLIIDTAGRLQNKTNLMKEIGKVRRVIEREIPEAPQEVLLVLDATTGQNAISQAKIFREATGVTGIILTKLDGTAKGGIVIAVAQEMDIPVKMVGIGETLEDLRDFSPEIFAQALFSK